MKPEAWKRRIGADTWKYLIESLNVVDVGVEDVAAEVLTRLYEVGWRGPERPPRVDPRGVKVLWPSADGDIPVLTSEGLEAYWRARGHRWVLLRAPQLCRAMAGPLAARLQEMLAAYEEQCRADEVEPIPAWADWTTIVGGEGPVVDYDALCRGLNGDTTQ